MKRQVIKKVLILWILIFLTSCANTLFYSNDCQRYLEAGDYKRAIRMGKEAIDLYPRNVEPYICISSVYLKKGDPEKAIDILKRAEKVAPSYEDLAVIYNRLGLVYHLKGDLNTALYYHEKHLKVSHEFGDAKGETVAMFNMADIYQSMGDVQKALFYYRRSLEVSADPTYTAFAYSNIAHIYIKEGKEREALENYLASYEQAKKTQDKKLIAISLVNVGDTYRRLSDFKNAFEYLMRGLELAKGEGDKKLQAYAYAKLGLLYKDKRDIESARIFFKRAYEIYLSLGDKDGMRQVQSEIKNLEKR